MQDNLTIRKFNIFLILLSVGIVAFFTAFKVTLFPPFFDWLTSKKAVVSQQQFSQAVEFTNSIDFTYDHFKASVDSRGARLENFSKSAEVINLNPVSLPKAGKITGFKEDSEKSGEKDITYQLSPDYKNWYYFKGDSWQTVGDCKDCSNTENEINANISKLPLLSDGLRVKAVLATANGHSPILHSVNLSFSGQQKDLSRAKFAIESINNAYAHDNPSFCNALLAGRHDEKITICHRTNSDTNPYEVIDVDPDAVDGEGNNDHTQHVVDENHKYGDIIPIIDLNSDGAINEADCTYVAGNDDDEDNGDGEKINICHRTDSNSNPYVFLSVSPKAVDGQGKNDHTKHVVDQNHELADIIPITDLNNDGNINLDDCLYTLREQCWDKSSVSINGECSDNNAVFTITNSGNNMSGTSEYRIFRNNVLEETGSFQLVSGGSKTIIVEAKGDSIRVEIDQRPGHPSCKGEIATQNNAGITCVNPESCHPEETVDNCGIQEKGSIGDYVWQDTDGDGNQDTGEPPLENVQINLFDKHDNLISSQISDLNGFYSFTNLVHKKYVVEVVLATLPAGYTLTTGNQPLEVNLGKDENYLTADFGFKPPVPKVSSIGGYIWDDANGNGTAQPNENPLVGVIVELYDGNQQLVATDTTDQNGDYYFGNLNPGNYTVVVVQSSLPAGYTITTNNQPLNITLGQGEDYSADFGYQLSETWDKSSISVSGECKDNKAVFTITNTGKDMQGQSEYRVYRNDVLEITENFQLNENQSLTVEVMANGDEIRLEADQRPGHPGNSQPRETVKNCGQAGNSSIGDYIWEDLNGDSVQDAGELSLANIVVKLYDNNQVLLSQTTTDNNGAYLFDNLLAGDYVVIVDTSTIPTGYVLSTNNQPLNISLGSNENYLTADFGYQPPFGDCKIVDFATPLMNLDGDLSGWSTNDGLAHLGVSSWSLLNNTATVAGYTSDREANLSQRGTRGLGVDDQENDEVDTFDNQEKIEVTFNDPQCIANLEVRSLYYHEQGQQSEEGDIDLVLDNSLVNNYHMVGVESLGSGNKGTWYTTVPNTKVDKITYYVQNDQDYSRFSDFAVSKLVVCPCEDVNNGSISGVVWDDVNKNGIIDNNEQGIPNVTVELYDNNQNLIATVVTDANGYYIFSSLPEGDYVVIVDQTTLPTNYSLTTANQPYSLHLNQNEQATQDFGYAYSGGGGGDKSSISGYVWNDSSTDGIKDLGETAFANIRVELYDSQDVLLQTVTTDSNGHYEFLNLDPGSYKVVVVTADLPSGYFLTTANQPFLINLPSNSNASEDFGYATWDGSDISVTGNCNSSVVTFTILNNGQDMAGSSQYRIYVDQLLTNTTDFQINGGASLNIQVNAGPTQTVTIEIDQRPGYPGEGPATLTVEGCSGGGGGCSGPDCGGTQCVGENCGSGPTQPNISVLGSCSDANAVFTIANSGTAMSGQSIYKVFRNNVLEKTEFYQLGAGQSIQVSVSAFGDVIKVETEQIPGSGSQFLAVAEVSGCFTYAPMNIVQSCVDGIANFLIENKTSTDMSVPSTYSVYRNDILEETQSYQLSAGAVLSFGVFANGDVIKVETEKEPGNPAAGTVFTEVSGCFAPPLLIVPLLAAPPVILAPTAAAVPGPIPVIPTIPVPAGPIIFGANEFILASIPSPMSPNGVVQFIVNEPQEVFIEARNATSFDIVNINTGDVYPLTYDPDLKLWRGELVFANEGAFRLQGVATNVEETYTREINSVVVTTRSNLSDLVTGLPIANASITVYQKDIDNGSFGVWNGIAFGQQNPMTPNADGDFSMILPQGEFYLIIDAPGYLSVQSLISKIDQQSSVSANVKLVPDTSFLSQVFSTVSNLEFYNQYNNFGLVVTPLSENPLLTIGAPAPAAPVTDSTGAVVNLLDKEAGKKFVMAVYSDWNTLSQEQIQTLENIINTIGAQIDILPLSTIEPDNLNLNQINRGDYTMDFYKPTDQFFENYKIISLPQFFVIDSNGNVLGIIVGPQTEQDLLNQIENLGGLL